MSVLEGLLLIVAMVGWVLIVAVLMLCNAKDRLRDEEPGAEDRYG